MRTMMGIALAVVLMVGARAAEAQVVQTVWFQGPPTTFVQPTPVVQTTFVQPAVVYRPLLRPFTRVVTPATTRVYAVPQPVVVGRPTIPVTVVSPTPVVTKRYRPILGGTVTRSW